MSECQITETDGYFEEATMSVDVQRSVVCILYVHFSYRWLLTESAGSAVWIPVILSSDYRGRS